jgi:hypothetical protein
MIECGEWQSLSEGGAEVLCANQQNRKSRTTSLHEGGLEIRDPGVTWSSRTRTVRERVILGTTSVQRQARDRRAFHERQTSPMSDPRVDGAEEPNFDSLRPGGVTRAYSAPYAPALTEVAHEGVRTPGDFAFEKSGLYIDLGRVFMQGCMLFNE